MSIMTVTGRASAQLGPAFDYSFARRDQPNAGDFNRRWEDINRRLSIQEAFIPAYDSALSAFLQDTLTRVDDFLRPAYDQIVSIGQLGALFTATSATSVAVGLGVKIFTLSPGIRDQFAAAAYLGIQSVDDPNTLLFGPLQSYDRVTGTLVVAVQQFTGAAVGSLFANWRISAAGTPTFLATAHGVGAYTQTEVDGYVATVKQYADASANTATSACVSKTGDTMTGGLTVPSIALGSAGDLKAYIDKGVRTDVAQSFSRVAMLQARKNAGASPLFGQNIFNGNTALTAADANKVHWLNGDGFIHTLPDTSTLASGDGFEFINYGPGTHTFKNSNSAISNFWYASNFGVDSVRCGPGQYLKLSYDNGIYICFRGLAADRGLNPDQAQTFTDAQKQQVLANADIAIPVGQCRLNFVSATQIRLDQYNGNKIWINGNYRLIPTAGVSISNAGLNANTLYYIYAYWTGATVALTASVTAPVTDPTYGHKTASGGASVTLVGMVYLNASSQFQDSADFRTVASYFNRTRKTAFKSNANVNCNSTSGAVIHAVYGLSWGEDEVCAYAVGNAQSNTQGASTFVGSKINGAYVSVNAGQQFAEPAANYTLPLLSKASTLAPMGLVYSETVLTVSGGVSNFSSIATFLELNS